MTSQKKALPKVVVCQNTTCKQQGAEQVLAAFERCVLDDVSVEPSGCLGQCGNGPMVIVLTENGEIETIDGEVADGEAVDGEAQVLARLDAEAKKGDGHKPQKIWYSGVKPADAFAIASQHFKSQHGKEESSRLRQPSAPQSTKQSFFWIWLVGLLLFFAMCGLMALVLGGPSHYG